MSVWPLVVFCVSSRRELLFVGGWWQGGRRLGVGELMARSESSDTRSSSACSPRGLDCSRGGLPTLLWEGVPQRRAGPTGLHCVVLQSAGHLCRFQGHSGFWFLSSGHDGLPVSVCRREPTPVAPGGKAPRCRGAAGGGLSEAMWVVGQGRGRGSGGGVSVVSPGQWR